MANRFWVGNGGNINDAAHWSATSGGASGASVPNSSDVAKFDSLSFTLPSQTVTGNVSFDCLDMDWTGATNSPTLAINSGLNIYGSLTFISAMSVTGTGTVSFLATSTGKTITMAGKAFGNAVSYNSTSGGWTYQDNFVAGGNIILSAGSLNTNGMSVSCANFNGSNSGVRSLTLGASAITVNGTWLFATTTNLTFSAGTSSITVIGATFDGGSLTYNNVTLNPSATTTITGNNTYSLLTGTTGKTIKVTSGTAQTALINFVMKGVTIQSVTAASPFTFSKSTGNVIFRNCSIKDCTAAGGAAFNAIAGSTSVSGNTGVTFGGSVVVKQDKGGRTYALNALGVLTAL